MENMEIGRWTIRHQGAARIRAGHPWAFANEIAVGLKDVAAGSIVNLFAEDGRYLATGYGNYHSLIAFRALHHSGVERGFSSEDLVAKALRAREFRERLGFGADVSHRLIFGEADFLPGLVVDRYITGERQTIDVAQILTAGMDRLWSDRDTLAEQWRSRVAADPSVVRTDGSTDGNGLASPRGNTSALVLRDDVSVRKLEGLAVGSGSGQLFGITDDQLAACTIQVASGDPHHPEPLRFRVDLADGQKTGFYLDQSANIATLLRLLNAMPVATDLKILDLFSYVGQWSAQVARFAARRGKRAICTVADTSAAALDLAAANIGSAGGEAVKMRTDLVSDGDEIASRAYDIVICDPPALIKSKKDYHGGRRAYMKVNEAAIRAARRGGVIVSCSCSHHLSADDLRSVLAQASERAGRTVRWIAAGQQGADHPTLAAFPEGSYLKALFGIVE